MAFIDGDNGENFVTAMLGFSQYGTKPNNGCYTTTLEQQQEMYDREYKELMALPKEELVKRLIGERPPLNVRIG